MIANLVLPSQALKLFNISVACGGGVGGGIRVIVSFQRTTGPLACCSSNSY